MLTLKLVTMSAASPSRKALQLLAYSSTRSHSQRYKAAFSSILVMCFLKLLRKIAILYGVNVPEKIDATNIQLSQI